MAKLLSTSEAAEFLRVSRHTFYDWTHKSAIPPPTAVRKGIRRFYDPKELRKWKKERDANVVHAIHTSIIKTRRHQKIVKLKVCLDSSARDLLYLVATRTNRSVSSIVRQALIPILALA